MDAQTETVLTLALVGFSTVFVALSVIAGLLVLVQKLDAGWQAREDRAHAQAIDKPPTIDNLTLVLITAAVATMMQGRFRIRRIRRLATNGPTGSSWSQQGRAVLLGSHDPERKAK